MTVNGWALALHFARIKCAKARLECLVIQELLGCFLAGFHTAKAMQSFLRAALSSEQLNGYSVSIFDGTGSRRKQVASIGPHENSPAAAFDVRARR